MINLKNQDHHQLFYSISYFLDYVDIIIYLKKMLENVDDS